MDLLLTVGFNSGLPNTNEQSHNLIFKNKDFLIASYCILQYNNTKFLNKILFLHLCIKMWRYRRLNKD